MCFLPPPKLCQFIAVVFFWTTAISAAEGRTLDLEKLPPSLSPWVDWVLYDHDTRTCPVVNGEAHCLWPGVLDLSFGEKGGQFVFEVQTDREMTVPLPGSDTHWPEQVRLDGKQVPVTLKDGAPSVAVSKGAHTIDGQFVWSALPEALPLPALIARIKLVVDGKTIPFPKRDEQGGVRLKGASDTNTAETIDLSVARRIEDGIPVLIETRIVVRASGKAREVSFPSVLLDGTVPLSVSAPIPVHLDEDGNMSLQIRPGIHTISIIARAMQIPEKLVLKPHAPPWPEQEVWVWQADETLRQVVLSGIPGVDPSRTDLSETWRTYPAYLVTAGNVLSFQTTRRGESSPPPDKINLERKMWLNLDGSGFTIQDRLSGELNRTGRVDLAPPGNLARATVNGRDELITFGANGASGVEIRENPLSVVAEWRLPKKGNALPAVGWMRNLESLSTTLYLPPGWRLMFTNGVDSVTDTWWAGWDLFSFFFVLIVAIAIGKLTRWYYGIIAILALVLSHHEDDAPLVVWAALLITLALLKVVPMGKLRIGVVAAWWLSVIWLAGVLVPFSVHQMRTGLFPQVADASQFSYDGYGGFEFAVDEDKPVIPQDSVAQQALNQIADEALPPPAPSPELQRAISGEEFSKISGGDFSKGDIASLNMALSDRNTAMDRRGGKKEINVKSKRYKAAQMTQDPGAAVQTGVGVPSWHWREWHLNWTGPVVRDHTMTLYMFSPKTNLVLAILRVLLLVIVAVRIAFEGGRIKTPLRADKAAGALIGLFVMLLVISVPFPSHAAPAQSDAATSVTPELLRELAARLTALPDCLPECVALPYIDLSVSNDRLSMAMDVHAKADSAFPIPGPADNWVPDQVEVDGRRTDSMAVLDNGYIYVRTTPGVHRVVVAGPMPTNGALSLTFQTPPKRLFVTAEGWSVDGLREDGKVADAIQFSKQVPRDDNRGEAEKSFDERTYPPWLEVKRELLLGIPWIVNTTVRRVSPPGTPIILSIPLLPGESVTASDVEVSAGAVNLSLGRDETVVEWTSTLAEKQHLTLKAPEGKPWSEVWQVECSPVWQCGFEGLAPMARKTDNRIKPIYRPRPGEALSIYTAKPKGADGASVTVDSTALSLSLGNRLVKAVLKLNIRTSRGGEQVLTLPEGAILQSIRVDGQPYPHRQDGQRIHISLKTGSQTILVEWQEDGGIRNLFQARSVSLGRPAANAQVTINMPRERWLIALGGPNWGPAILFWGFLLTILLSGLILGHIGLSPLKSRQWMLLSLGLTQVPVPVMIIIVSWFFVFAWREKHALKNHILYNIAQVLCAIWTVIALGCLVGAIYTGLAIKPDMQVSGFGSTNDTLNWYVDRVPDLFPTPWILSVPMIVWKIIMLIWALWLAASVVKWAPWAWRAFAASAVWKRASGPAESTTAAHPPAAPSSPLGNDASIPPPKQEE